MPPPGWGAKPITVEWEDGSLPFFSRLFRTIKDSSFAPTEFYQRAAQSDEPMPGVMAGVAGNAVGGVGLGIQIGGIYLLIGAFGAAVSSSSSSTSSSGGPPAGAFAVLAAFGLFAAIIYPVILTVAAFINPWITGGLHHVLLMLYRGASRPYSASVRVAGYANATNAWLLVPFVGGIMAMVCHLVSLVVGLSTMHRCSVGKVLLALFTPALVCCLCYALVLVFTLSMGAASH